MRNLIPRFVHEQFKRGATSGSFPAATLFVDISGFTPLTETLMQHRKDGAEVLSEALEAVFAPLVGQVHARGGLIPLFAGDAFAAVFPHQPAVTPNAPLHALGTAIFIQDLLTPGARDRTFRTKYGDFAIGVRVGLSYGLVRWGIPGQGGRFSFYFRGPGVDGCTRAEGLASTGQIVADDQIWPYVRQVVTAQPVAGTGCHRLTACSLNLPAPGADLPSFSREDLCPFVPAAVLDRSVRAEFREVCPVFLSFEEPMEEAPLHRFLAAAIGLAEAYGGTFSQIDFGDKGGIVLVWFGAPLSYENNVERAADFLLACRREEWPLRWRAGLTFGTVWAGIRGGIERCEYSLIGDVMNLASRLAMKAGWDEVWASPAAQAYLEEAFHLKPRGAYHLKGMRAETAVYQLLGRREWAEPAIHRGQMVGREAELDRLVACVQPIFGGRCAGLVYIHGEAGVGKSRLVHELRQRLAAKGVRWFLCPADQILRQSLNPFRRFLYHYFDQSRERTAEKNRARFDGVLNGLIAGLQSAAATQDSNALELADELERTRSFLGALVDLRWAGSLYEQLDPELRFENTLVAFKTLLLAESLSQPVVLQLEDLHWLDTDSPGLVKLLARNAEAYPFAIICTSRFGDDGGRVTLAVDPDVLQQEIELGTLALGGVRALAAQMLQGEIADALATFLTARTDGNPFFVEQLVLDLRERGAVARGMDGLWSASGEGAAEVPTTIAAVLIARLDRLVAQVKEVVQTAAVLGREFEVQVLSHMLRGDEEVPARVKQAEAEKIWTALSEVRYLFRHGLLRDAAYDMQLRARLRELHILAGEAIEQVYAANLAPHYADLTYHFGRAEDAERERHYAKLTGEEAARQFANAEAVAHFSRALELTPADDLAGCYALLLAREKVYELQGLRNAQMHDLAELEVLAGVLDDTQARAEVALRQANCAQVMGDYRLTIEAAQQALALAQDEVSQAEGHLAWARALARTGEYEAARAHLKEALSLARETGLRQACSPASRTVEAESLLCLGVVCLHQNDHAGARDCWEKCLDMARETGNRRGVSTTLNNLGSVYVEQGDYAKALDCWEQALRARREIGNRRGVGGTLGNLGFVASFVGDYAGAQEHFEQALGIARECGDRRSEAIVLSNLGGLVHHLGDNEAARQYSQQALFLAREIGDRYVEGYALDHLGHALAGLGQLAEADDAYGDAYALRREFGHLASAMDSLAGLARVSLAQGDLLRARNQVEEILGFLEVNTLAGAEEVFRIYLTCYHVLRVTGDSRAHEILNTAHALLQERAARIEDVALRRSFLENVAYHREVAAAYQAMQAVPLHAGPTHPPAGQVGP